MSLYPLEGGVFVAVCMCVGWWLHSGKFALKKNSADNELLKGAKEPQLVKVFLENPIRWRQKGNTHIGGKF